MFDVPQSPKRQRFVLGNFLGVDFTSVIPDKRRASNLINLINENGYLETRPGYAQIGDTLDGPINGVWNIDADTNIFIVHAGTKLYKSNATFTTFTELFSGMADAISNGYYINNKLVILDGVRPIVYGLFGSTWSANYLDQVGYIPITAVSRSPDGVNSTSYEPLNLINSFRINSFLSDGVANTYYLDAQNLDNVTPTITQLNINGDIVTRKDFTFDRVNGIVVFDAVPESSPVDGRDNIFIKFSKTNTELLSYVQKCTIGILYGYDGNENRLFITGNPDFPNIDWHSETNDGTYFPIDNYTQIGYAPIVNYSKLNDGTLAIHKDVSDTDNTVYYRKSALYNGIEIFPIDYGVNSVGCIARNANANLLNDPLILTNEGVYGVVSSQMEEKFAMERSYYVKKKLLAEPNLQNAISVVYRNKYYLAINNHIYVADSRYKSYANESQTEAYQYEWYYWEDVPVRCWFKYNNDLYFGTSDGKIVKFNTTNLNYTTPINCRFESTFLDLNSITDTKTIKSVTVISKPNAATKFDLGYVTEEGESAIITKTYSSSVFPKTLNEKEKIPKFMFVKFYIENDTDNKVNFYQIACEYVYSGRYRGE